MSRQLQTRPLPVTPVPIGYCERNRRFDLRRLLFYLHTEQSLRRLHVALRTSHPSGSRLWSDPNKEILSRPWQVSLPQKTVGTTPRPRLGIHKSCGSPCSGANPQLAHGVGVPSDQITTELSIFKGRDSGQSSLVVLSQPQYGLTAPSQPYKLSSGRRLWSY